MSYRTLMRRRLLEQIYDKLSDEEKRIFVQLTMDDKDHREIMQALGELKKKSDANHHSFGLDLAANVAGNAIFDGITFVLSKIVKKF